MKKTMNNNPAKQSDHSTNPMEQSDIYVCVFMYAVCLFFFIMAVQLPGDARIYPICLIAALAALTTLQLVNMIRAAKKSGIVSGWESFKDFLPKQFFVIAGMIVAYLVLMYITGFYISTVIFMLSALLFLKVKRLQLVIATAAILAIVFIAFTTFLGVHLPSGLLF